MQYTLYVQGTSGGRGTTGGSSGGTSGGSSGGKTGGSSTSGGSTGGSKSGGSTSGGKNTTSGSTGSTSTNGGTSTGGVTIKKPKDLAKLPPVSVPQPNGPAIVMNMNDFCVLPNANALNTVAFQQCLTRKKHDDDDMPMWGIVLIVAFIAVLVVAVAAYVLSSD